MRKYIMRDLVTCLERGGDLADVKGIAWRDGDLLRVNQNAPLIYDLDGLPFPARDLIDMSKYAPSIGHYHRLPATTMMGQRGCKHECIFCHTNMWMGHGERYRSAKNVVDEMEELQNRYGVKDILFWDNNLTEDYAGIHARCDEILRRKLTVIWSGNTRSDTLDLATAKLMRKAGCWKLLIGVESGVQKNLDTLKKGESLAQIERGVRICQQVGIRVFATVMFGIPGETYEEGLRSIEFAKKLNADYTKFFTIGVHPGTALHDMSDRYGTCLGHAQSQSHQSTGFVPHTMTKGQLDELIHRANRSFYMRPAYIAMKLRSIRSPGDIYQNVIGFRAYSGALWAELEARRAKRNEVAAEPVATTRLTPAAPRTTLGVVIAHRDSPELERCVRAILAGSRVPDELVVVDDGSVGPLPELPVRVIRREHAGPAAARNVGALETRADVLVFIDADVEVGPDTLARLEQRLADPDITAVQAVYDADCPVDTVPARLSNVLQRQNLLSVQGDLAGLSSFCVAIRRAAFEAVGGFDERVHRATVEDDNLGLALAARGYRVVVAKEITVRHYARPSAVGLMRRMASMAEDRVLTMDSAVLPTRTHHRPELLAATAMAGLGLASLPFPPLALLGFLGAVGVQARWVVAAADSHGASFAAQATPLLAALPAAAAVGTVRGLVRRLVAVAS